ncbi:hypothetical protein GCM10009777_04210 [Microbacterium pumilum]|uniref:Uncharacterized protein n=1 Tax=Microbacterium pumilum TaxID=344165 RepID=A0ABP5D7F5_9MICO
MTREHGGLATLPGQREHRDRHLNDRANRRQPIAGYARLRCTRQKQVAQDVGTQFIHRADVGLELTLRLTRIERHALRLA